MTLLKAVRLALTELADPARAEGMRSYMKSEMPFLGVTAVPRRAALRRVFAEHRLDSAPEWRRAVLALWREAEYREERYAAIELTGAPRRTGRFQTLDALPMYEEMIVTGAWWDYVDDIAVHRIGPLLPPYPDTHAPLDAGLGRTRRPLEAAHRHHLPELRSRPSTDAGLLYACIEPSLSDSEFFPRKAIGWALRQYAKTNPRRGRPLREAPGHQRPEPPRGAAQRPRRVETGERDRSAGQSPRSHRAARRSSVRRTGFS